MKRKIFLIIMLVLSFAVKAMAQVDTLNVSIDPLSASSYAPQQPFFITVEFQRNLGTSASVQVKCYIPSTVAYVPSSGDVYSQGVDTGGAYILFERTNFSGSSRFSFQVKFIADSCSAQTAIFTPVISANDASTFTGASVTANLIPSGTISWSIAYYSSFIENYNANNMGTAFQNFWLGAPQNVQQNYYYNTQCSADFMCNDTLFLALYAGNGGQQSLDNAIIKFNFNENDGVIGILDDNTGLPVSHSSTGTGTSSYQFYVVDGADHTLHANNDPNQYYYKGIRIIINPLQFNQSVCFTPLLEGTNACDGSPYTQTCPQSCITIDTLAAVPVPDYSLSQSPTIGCSDVFNYNIVTSATCTSCTPVIQNGGVTITVPHQVQINSIDLPELTGTDTAVLTGHYYYGNSPSSIDSFSFSYNAAFLTTNSTGATISLSQLVKPIYNLTTTFIADYKITTSVSSNKEIYLGSNKFTVLSTEWPAMTIPVVPNSNIQFPFDFFSANWDTSFIISILSRSDPQVNMYSQNICSQQSVYCVGDTVAYSIGLQNAGYGNLVNGVLEDLLPGGFKYLPGTLKCQSENQANYVGCFCPACAGYADINFTDQPITDFSQNLSSNDLKWNLPLLPYSCDQNPATFVVTFKAVITASAEYSPDGEESIQTIYNSAGANLNEAANIINVCQKYPTLTPEKQVSLDSIHWTQDTTAIAGQKIYYKITLKNNGNIPLDSIRMVDILPALNDHTVLNCNTPRNSTGFVSLTSTLKNPPGINTSIKYSADSSPVRTQFLGFPNPVACESGSFGPLNGIDIQTVRAFQIDYGNSVLLPGDSNVYIYSAQVPTGSLDGTHAYNTFAVTATVPMSSSGNDRLSAAESQNVGITIINPVCQCVKGIVWIDSIQNGVQDSQEHGINNIPVLVYDSATNVLKDSSNTTFSAAAIPTPGNYQICNLPAGSYYIVAEIPDSLINPPKPDSNGVVITDTLIVNQRTPSFTINCSNTTNNTRNIIITPTTICDDDCTKRKPIIFSQLF
jgi:uncharacterized repeat protein (TIGR01451 family)